MKGKMMKSKLLCTAGLLLVLGVTVAAHALPNLGPSRGDCPGTVTCPLTGEKVCKDRCPLTDAARADCPGKIECPLTGEPICRDRCPLGTRSKIAADAQAEVPPCCRGKK
jgi:hypothetical protein